MNINQKQTCSIDLICPFIPSIFLKKVKNIKNDITNLFVLGCGLGVLQGSVLGLELILQVELVHLFKLLNKMFRNINLVVVFYSYLLNTNIEFIYLFIYWFVEQWTSFEFFCQIKNGWFRMFWSTPKMLKNGFRKTQQIICCTENLPLLFWSEYQ